MKITGFTCWLVETEPGPQFFWRDGLAGSHGDVAPGTRPRKAVIRMDTDAGIYGAMELGRGASVIDLIGRRYHTLVGENPLMTERLWTLIWEIDRVEEIHMRSLGILDVLSWDVKSKAANLPVTSEVPPAPTPGTLTLKPRPAAVATLADVRSTAGRQTVVDARAREFYTGESDNNGRIPRPGHVSGAVSLPYTSLVQEDGRFRSAADVDALLKEVGVTSQREIERIVRDGTAQGGRVRLRMTLTSEDAPALQHVVETTIELR